MKKIMQWVLAATLICGASVLTSCSKVDTPSTPDTEVLEQSLVGLWWDEYEYADVTEAGVPFSRVLLAVKADADHTGCIYLGVLGDTSDEPIAVYGGPQDAGFTWRLLDNGSIVISDPTTGENYSLARTRDESDSSYGDNMTDVSSTSLNYSDGNLTVTNGSHSGTLEKADAEKEAEIEEQLASLSPDRQSFEAQLSQMLADSKQYIRLDPTMRGAKLLTEFISQLKIDALRPQAIKFILNAFQRGMAQEHTFTDPGFEEARWALDNSNVPNDTAKAFFLLNANDAFNNNNFEFTTGKDTADYEPTDDGALTISLKNATTGAVTKLRLSFSGKDDGVIIFMTRLGNEPVAIQFPHAIDVELLRSESGNGMDTELMMKGQVMLESTEGKKFISLKHSAWRATLEVEAEKTDRYEIPRCELIHHADHTVEFSTNLGINGKTVLTIKAHNDLNPYSDEEIDQLRELRDIAPIWKGAYTVLKAFNSRSGQIEVNVLEDILVNVDVLDAGNCMKAIGYAMKNRREQPETINPWTDLLNQSATCTVTQLSTGVKAEGKFITSTLGGVTLPSPALRFKGESDFRVVHDRMNASDLENFTELLKGFAEPLNVVNGLLKAVQEKGEELKALRDK